MSGRPITAVLAICSPGMIPVRFIPMIRKKNVIRTGMKRLPSFSPSVSKTIELRTKPSMNSRAA